jgi:hypothetical protein
MRTCILISVFLIYEQVQSYRIFDLVRTSATTSMQQQQLADQEVESGRVSTLIQDYSNWKDEQTFQKQFRKLVEGLNLFYKCDCDSLAHISPAFLRQNPRS